MSSVPFSVAETDTQNGAGSAYPRAPERTDQLGIPEALAQDLVLRRLLVDGVSGLCNLNERLKLSIPIVENIFRQLQRDRMVEVTGMDGDDYRIRLTGGGRALAAERMQVSQYAGPAPVCLDHYRAQVKAQSAEVEVDRASMRAAFSDLVLSEMLLDQLGPAVISQSSMFLYGPAGSGKTSVAERLLRVYRDTVYIPHAVEVDGQIISLYDPVVHRRVEDEAPYELDGRWVPCHRPCVMAGGELVLEMLELRRDAGSGVYVAPLQMKANNGMLIIDDFGRQIVSAEDLLNRWIVPLDRRLDYLSLSYGFKFDVPFELMVVFSSNMNPAELGDGAFVRRIQNKIFVEGVGDAAFDEIFRRVTEARKITTEPGSAAYLRALCADAGTELSASYPGAICRILIALNKYEKRPPHAGKEDLERAAGLFFARTDAFQGNVKRGAAR